MGSKNSQISWWKTWKGRAVPILLVVVLFFLAYFVARVDELHKDIQSIKRLLELELKIKN